MPRLIVGALFTLFVATISGGPSQTPTPAMAWQASGAEREYFDATGQHLQGKFLEYWRSRGGLAIFGYPLTPAFVERGYLVQYFERARFELHPEFAGSPYEVSLGQLGRERLAAEGRTLPRLTSANVADGEELFSATGFKVSGPFLKYWKERGGLAQFGYPLTPELQDGTLTVQYFERARFELHPENGDTEYQVLLTLLGRERADKLDPALRERWVADPPQSALRTFPTGVKIPLLSPVIVTSDVGGEMQVLGGDNRVYATYSMKPGVPRTIYPAGAPGPQSLMLQNAQGQVIAALWAAYTVMPPNLGIHSGDPVLDGLYPRVKGYLEQDVVVYNAPADGREVRGYRSPDSVAIWLRDHVHQSKGFKYFERDMKSTLDYFRSTQRPDGSFDDYLFRTLATPVYTGQIEIEADREYLFVEGVWTAWQATGDDEWLRLNLGAMERGLEHTFSDPRRWAAEYGLIKRAFTIDTWDYEQGSTGEYTRRSFDDQTRWSIMHGDNTGAYRAARLLAGIERYFGRLNEAKRWDKRADDLLYSLNRFSWNGSFYTHQIHLTPIDPVWVDESTQLSLSNAYALNRGTLTHEQAAAVIRTYQARRAANRERSFAEWYSIDPPFVASFNKPGEYANGGIMPLVGGELARGAFEQGFEAYGLDILRRYWDLTERSGGSYLWYYPDGRPGIREQAQTISTDGWGSAAMLYALTEGLAGVADNGKLYEHVALSPRWATTDRKSAQVALRYEASGAYFAYDWQRGEDNSIRLVWGGSRTKAVRLHLLLPSGFVPRLALLEGAAIPFSVSQLEGSYYLDAVLPGGGYLEVK